MSTLEQQARDILERCGWEEAQQCTAGDITELANLLAEVATLRSICREAAIDLLSAIDAEEVLSDSLSAVDAVRTRLWMFGGPRPIKQPTAGGE